MKQQSGAAVKSAARALDVIEHVARRGPLNARAISAAAGIPESSLSYLLTTLVDRDWLIQHTDRTYSVGPALGRLTTGALPSLHDQARRALRDLAHLTGETASLFLRHGSEIEAIEVEPSRHFLRFTPQTGSLVPLHSFAAGKALLAIMPAAALQSYFLGHRQQFTEHTLVGEPEIRADLERIRQRGYALAREEHAVGVMGIGIALDATLSLSVAIPSPRFDHAIEQRTAAELLRVRARLVGGTHNQAQRNTRPGPP